ncbi:MAG: hypothetical protein D6768_01660 [Chloroflexi bacterium]|nr:MAG: hypothetical protein D6768_01660 [Chloroflexota bacterium]
MAEVTVNIPDPIFNIIKKRAEDTGNTPEGIIIANLAIIFGPVRYDSSKWLKSFPPDAQDYTVPWP